MHRSLAGLALALWPCAAAWSAQWLSPGGELGVQVLLDADGRPGYQLFRSEEPVIRRSPLGVRLDGASFHDALTVVSTSEVTTVQGQYRLWAGKREFASYRASELRQCYANAGGEALCITLPLFDDGLAYRYEFPGESGKTHRVVEEYSGVHFFPQTRAWLQPKAEAQSGWMNTNPSYEEDYRQDIPVGTPSPTESGWVYPALFHYRDHWIVLTEAGMDGRFPGSNLARDSEDGLYRLRYPLAAEVVTNGPLFAESEAAFHSPWRLVVVGDLATVTGSTLGTDLAEPLALKSTNFIQPGIAAWSWGILKDDSVVYPVQKAFVDFASSMNWQYVLVDVNWDRTIGYERIAELADYAAGKGVGLFLWYNSSGDWNETVYSPKSRLLTTADRRSEFRRLREMGIRGVKVDFFPGDGASVWQYYIDLLRDAADLGLMVNFHGTTLPRGLQRSYPNLITSEAVKGLEMITFFQDAADREATHVAMLPFTRNLFDPMDFTPMVLGDIPNIERKTSNAFQLALPVLLLSGVQHLVTTPEQMQDVPEFARQFLRELPGQWDDSRLVAGFPGKYVVIARRSGDRWYVAGVNALESRQLDLDLSFIGAERGTLIRDGKTPRTLNIETAHGGEQTLELTAGGGFVMLFEPSRRSNAGEHLLQ